MKREESVVYNFCFPILEKHSDMFSLESLSVTIIGVVVPYLTTCLTVNTVKRRPSHFSILKHSNKYNVRTLESILINRFVPALNKQVRHFGKSRIE